MEALTTHISELISETEVFLTEHSSENWRDEFISAALEAGIPTRKTEAWKYTRIKPLFDKGLRLVTDHPTPSGHPSFPGGELATALENSSLSKGGSGIALPLKRESTRRGRVSIESFSATHITTQNGHLISSDELPKGVSIHPISEAKKPSAHFNSDPITALAAGLFSAGILVKVEANVELDKPIIIAETTDLKKGETACVRHKFEIGEGANVQVIEHHSAIANSEGLLNRITEMEVAENAHFDHHQIQDIDGLNTVHSIEVQQAKSSVFNTAVYSFSGNMTRNNHSVSVNGERCETNLYGLHITSEKEHIDNHTHIDHRVPNCNSKEVYRGVLGGRSTGVFNGKVFVHQDAQLTNAHQSNRNILISDSATMNSKPELEIYADDVKCSHGCTIGQMDKEAMFYLRSRGLSVEASINLLLHAFAGEVLTAINNEELRAWIEERIAAKMKAPPTP